VSVSTARRDQRPDVVRDYDGVINTRLFYQGVKIFGVVFYCESRFERRGLRAPNASRIIDQTKVLVFELGNDGPPAFARHRPPADKDDGRTVSGYLEIQRTVPSLDYHAEKEWPIVNIESTAPEEMQTQPAEDWFKYNLREKLW